MHCLLHSHLHGEEMHVGIEDPVCVVRNTYVHELING